MSTLAYTKIATKQAADFQLIWNIQNPTKSNRIRAPSWAMSVDLAGGICDQTVVMGSWRIDEPDFVLAAVHAAGGSVSPDGNGITVRGWTVQATKAPILSTVLDLARHVTTASERILLTFHHHALLWSLQWNIRSTCCRGRSHRSIQSRARWRQEHTWTAFRRQPSQVASHSHWYNTHFHSQSCFTSMGCCKGSSCQGLVSTDLDECTRERRCHASSCAIWVWLVRTAHCNGHVAFAASAANSVHCNNKSPEVTGCVMLMTWHIQQNSPEDSNASRLSWVITIRVMLMTDRCMHDTHNRVCWNSGHRQPRNRVAVSSFLTRLEPDRGS